MTNNPERPVLSYFEGLAPNDVMKMREEVIQTLERTRAEIDRLRDQEKTKPKPTKTEGAND